MTRTATLTLLAALTPACVLTPALGDVWTVSPTDEPLLQAARAAAESWCQASDGEYCPTIGPVGRPIRRRSLPGRRLGTYWSAWIEVDATDLLSGAQTLYARDDTVCRTRQAVHAPEGVEGCYRAATPAEALQAVVAHELGHAAGLGHLPARDALLASPGGWAIVPTATDVAAL